MVVKVIVCVCAFVCAFTEFQKIVEQPRLKREKRERITKGHREPNKAASNGPQACAPAGETFEVEDDVKPVPSDSDDSEADEMIKDEENGVQEVDSGDESKYVDGQSFTSSYETREVRYQQ